MAEPRLLMISRDDILQGAEGEDGELLFRTMARLTRMGFHLLATAPQPDDWSRSHGGPDDALLGPQSIRKRLTDFGGFIDGIYYVPRSLFTQKRNREQALKDIMKRYAIDADRCYLFSASTKFVEVAAELGIHATELGQDQQLIQELMFLLKFEEDLPKCEARCGLSPDRTKCTHVEWA
jgi:hypothetical protein